MNDREKIEQFKKDIKSLENKINNCIHSFNEPIFDPEKIKEPSGYEMVTQGSDHWYRHTSFKEVQKDRWSRECKICGKKEYTYKKEPVIKEYKPKF